MQQKYSSGHESALFHSSLKFSFSFHFTSFSAQQILPCAMVQITACYFIITDDWLEGVFVIIRKYVFVIILLIKDPDETSEYGE